MAWASPVGTNGRTQIASRKNYAKFRLKGAESALQNAYHNIDLPHGCKLNLLRAIEEVTRALNSWK